MDKGKMGLRTITAKFGGTSMGTAKAIAQVAEIVGGMKGPKVAVVSATSGTTDKLILLAETAAVAGNWREILDGLIEKHAVIMQELGVKLSLENFWKELGGLCEEVQKKGSLELYMRDEIIGFGERISSNILPAVLVKNGFKSVAVDAYEIIFTDNNFSEGNVDFEKTYKAVAEKLPPLLKDGVIPVVTGFIGQAENGQYITIGRGGSDYSGAIVAGALDASELQIWTDVDGIFNIDPRLEPRAKALEKLSFKEAAELAFFGAKVLHPKTIKPAIAKNIPVKILNTFNPSAPGTLVINDEEESIKSVTYKKGISIVNICSAGMLTAPGFMSKLFQVFARAHIDVDVVATSEVSVSVTVDNGEADKILDQLAKFATVRTQKGMAIVCLVGAGIIHNKHVLKDLFAAVEEHDISMVSQGSSKRNITFLVKESEAQEVVKKVFNKFFI
ncbi:aspartate kinase [Candidatus Peregrinibacteria bacterium]|nr:aspartate kinase [Candidatus Peregrinibacteria bacterium]